MAPDEKAQTENEARAAASAVSSPASSRPERPAWQPGAAEERAVAAAARQHGSIPAGWYHDAGHAATQERETAQRARDDAAGVGVPEEDPAN